jgi:hypothetical protein
VPAAVTALAAVQRDAQILVHCKLPDATTEKMPLKAAPKVELRIGPGAEGPFHPGEWAAQAKPVQPEAVTNGIAFFTIPSTPWTGQSVVIAARAIGANGKASDWSALEALPIVTPPARPGPPKVENTAQGLRLSWDGPPGDFRIFRRLAGEKEFAPVAEVEALTWTDQTTEFGKEYTYIVQRIVKLGVRREAESERSGEGTRMAEDTFPPAAPAGLRASPAAGSVELSWDRNTEPDLGGYRVYRAAGGGAFEKIADVSQIPSYSDRNVKSGERYRYAVSAVDKSGNEGPQSAVEEASVP